MAPKEMSGWRCEKGKNVAVGGVGITCLTAFVLALSAVGTANASPTALNVQSANATVNGALPVTMSFPLERSGDLGFDTWLHYETEDGSARAGTDYTSSSGYLKLPAGTSEKSIPIQVSGQAAFAPDKQFSLKLLGATGVGATPSFAERVGFAVGSVRGRAKVADVNGDGKPDLIVPNTKTVSVLLNITTPGAASPSFAAPQTFEVGANPDVAPGDVNGDGRPDLVVTNSGDDDFSVLINTTPVW
jgi:VCBS repeat protein/Calx-beta domain-containing protein